MAAKKSAPKKSAVKAVSAKKSAKKSAPKKAATKKAAKKSAVTTAKKAPKKSVKKSAPKKSVAKKAAPKKSAPKKAAAKKAAAKPVATKAAPGKKTVSTRAPGAPAKPATPVRYVIVKGPIQDGIASTKDFDLKFLFAQREALLTERVKLVGQAERLEKEANSLIEDAEMGDVQFDEEGGQGDSLVVERDLDLFLSAQAKQTVEEIDAALARLKKGEYGYSTVSGLPIPKERLRALPWATELVTERAGVFSRS
jgi:RNA polymerase-binding transcription factor DksA